VDLNTGTLSFRHVDVSLPGNSGLEVAIRRTRAQGDIFKHRARSENTEVQDQKISHSFSDWMLEVPNISVTTALGVIDCNYPEGAGGQVILNFIDYVPADGPRPRAPSFNEGSVITVPAHQVSSGVVLNIPGSGGQKLINEPSGVNWPTGTTAVTKDNWVIKCGVPDGFNHTFIATAPDGTTYKLDKRVVRKENEMDFNSVSTGGAGGATFAFGALDRAILTFQASEVKDVNGNWVRYEYNARGWVTRIHSNDGREIRVITAMPMAL
jgi:YD repeat-containing protein